MPRERVRRSRASLARDANEMQRGTSWRVIPYLHGLYKRGWIVLAGVCELCRTPIDNSDGSNPCPACRADLPF